MIKRIRYTHVKISRTLVKYIFSYAIVLIIPLTAFNYFLTYNVLPDVRNDIINANYANLYRIQEQFESKLTEMERIAVSITANQRLTPYMIKQNEYKASEGISELRNYKFANDYIFDILYYIRGDDRIYGAYQSSNLEFMGRNIYTFMHWDQKNFNKDINMINNPVIKPVDKLMEYNKQRHEIISYIYPITPHYPYATVIFLIDNEKINEMIGNIFPKYNENLLILDKAGTIITSINNEDSNIDDIKFIYSKIKNKNEVCLKLQNNRYYAISITSPKNGWTYLSIVKNDVLLEKINNIRIKINITILLVFLFGLVIISAFSYINYFPLNKLYKRAGNLTNLLGGPLNEIETVNRALDEILGKNSQLKENIEYFKPFLRKYLFSELLAGKCSNNMLETIIRKTEIELYPIEDSSHVVFILKILNGNGKQDLTDDYRSIYRAFVNILGDYTHFCEMDNQKDKLMTLIHFFKSKKDASDGNIKLLMHQAITTIKEDMGLDLIIGVGSIYEDILSLSKSYMEALKAMEFHEVCNKEEVVFFDEICMVDCLTYNISEYPYFDLSRLFIQIKSGNLENSKEILAKLINLMKNGSIPVFIIRCIIFDLYNMLFKVSIERNIDFISVSDFNIQEISSYNINDIDKLGERICQVVEKVCKTISQKVLDEDHLIKSIIDYINNNYYSNNFSVDAMAGNIGLTPPYISQLFKKRLGCTISEYVWKIRRDHAKYLLKNSNMSLESIVNEIGYIDVTSFIKKFKKAEGLSPGEYRKTSDC